MPHARPSFLQSAWTILSFALRRPPPHPAAATLITCQRNEGPFLIEWLAYHKAIGFRRIVVGANDCTDGSHEMLARLAELGEIEYHPFKISPDIGGAQGTFEQVMIDRGLVRFGDWVCWLDLDEFLNIHLGEGQLADLCAAMSAADGIRINWRMFGADANPPWPGRQLHADLCRCAPADHAEPVTSVGQKTIKTFYRFVPGLRVKNHGPALGPGSIPLRLRWLNGAGKPTRITTALTILLAGEKGVHLTRSGSNPRFDWVQINHYFLRHPSLIAWRQARGRGSNFVPEKPTSAVWSEFAERHTPEHFARFNRTDDEDRSILRHLPATDREMARLLADDTVRHWHEHARAGLAAFLSGTAPAAE